MRPHRFLFNSLRPLLLLLAASALHADVLVTLSTSSVSLASGGSATLTALVTGATDKNVTWSYAPLVGTLGTGNAASTSGTSVNNYVAPANVTLHTTVAITATSVENPAKSATVRIDISPSSITVSPSTVTLVAGGSQQFTATGGGSGYVWSISPSVGTIDGTGLYYAPSTISAAQTVTVTATSSTDSTISGSARVSLTPAAAVSVTVSPSTVTLNPSRTQQFTATVANTDVQTVSWTISPSTGAGTIDQTGLYTAPSTITAGKTTVTVTAASTVDPSKYGTATVSLATVLDIGTGSPSAAVQQLFITAFYRAGFNQLVSLPPVAAVRKLGTTGLVQEFNDAGKTGAKLALVVPNSSVIASSDDDTYLCYQLWADLYSYFSSVGVTTAGYPTADTQSCPTFDSSNSCTWDTFSNGYALFAYKTALLTGQDFTIRSYFYTKWTALGGIGGLGRPVDEETTVTSSLSTTATVQTYARGAIYLYTSGANNGKYFGVMEPLYSLYVTNGGPTGSLGFPVTDEIVLSTGVHRQTFQNGGSLEYTPGNDPTVRLAVAGVSLTGTTSASGGTLKMNLNDKKTVSATAVATTGDVLTGRTFSWTTSNSRVVTVTSNNDTAVLTAVGGGTAIVTVSSEGVVSPRLTITVTAPCCAVGETAPTTVQQAFQDALTRNKLTVALPAQAPAARVGSGYTQTLQSTDSNPVVYLLAKSDRGAAAYVVTGNILKAYQLLGGAGGTLGYPASDATSGGRQMFENTVALAGNPVRQVAGGVLTKWAALSYETGAAGSPTSDASAFSTFGANSGNAQSFANGVIYAATAGPRAGQAYFVSGLILARYLALGGAGGVYGMPTRRRTGRRPNTHRPLRAATSTTPPATPRRRSTPPPPRPVSCSRLPAPWPAAACAWPWSASRPGAPSASPSPDNPISRSRPTAAATRGTSSYRSPPRRRRTRFTRPIPADRPRPMPRFRSRHSPTAVRRSPRCWATARPACPERSPPSRCAWPCRIPPATRWWAPP